MKNKAYDFARNRKYDGCQRALAGMVHKFFNKKTGLVLSVNEQLAEELRKPVIQTFKRWKVYLRFKDDIWAADLAKMESSSSMNKHVKYLLCVIDVFSKYEWVTLLKDKKGKTVLNVFIEIVNEFNCQIHYGLINEDNFTINLCKND